ncbi:MAG: 4-(cytidine 5'-diphospho)-2-C-methyl-D-erythritol kinase [Bacteroidales bacterium]|nr:4-(cytidine 5'-diphospho)-2-C-methyl-D-erythritol kinase [Bacteroidales bacterium]
MISYPNCKINLGLHISSRRPDGYHNLESVFVPVFSLCDELEITPVADCGAGDAVSEVAATAAELYRSDCRFVQEGIPIDGPSDSNLCVKAYRLLREEFGSRVGAVTMRLRKVIPFGAGLGGGSSDAAFTLRMLNEMFSLGLSDDALCQRALRLGADCPFFIRNRAAYVTGIGDQIETIPFDFEGLGLRVVIEKPHDVVSTREAYASVIPRNLRPETAPSPDLRQALRRPVSEWPHLFVNDFEASIFPNHPLIARLKQQFYDQGALYASMSGSGSAVFALFEK